MFLCLNAFVRFYLYVTNVHLLLLMLQVVLSNFSTSYSLSRADAFVDSASSKSDEMAVQARVQVTPFLRSGWVVGHANR